MMSPSIRERLFRAFAQTLTLVIAGLVVGALCGSQCGCGSVSDPSPSCTAHEPCAFTAARAGVTGIAGICEVDADVAGPACYARCDVMSPDPCGQGGASATDDGVCYCIDLESSI